MKIMMLGWEYPPNITGGLGVASQGISEGLAKKGNDVTFFLPKKTAKQVSKSVHIMGASDMKPDFTYWKAEKKYEEVIHEVEIGKLLVPYLPPQAFQISKQKKKVISKLESTEESDLLEKIILTGEYNENLHAELVKYALLAVQASLDLKPEIIHAHDWVTFRAGRMVKKITGMPLCLHVHSTEYDRNGMYAQPFVIEEEQKGLDDADKIFCVSEKLKETVVSKYKIDPNKITVVANALNLKSNPTKKNHTPNHIAFVGRLTHQKSPATFIDIAREMISRGHDFKFTMIGDGYLMDQLKQKIVGTSFEKRITFTGFLDRQKVLRKLNDVDLLIMPSNSEPFGLVALEAILKGIPVAAAKGSGISEFIPSIPEVDLWDLFSYNKLVERLMTNMKYRNEIIKLCSKEASKLSWSNSSNDILETYKG